MVPKRQNSRIITALAATRSWIPAECTDHRQQIALGVYRDVALAPLDFLACVVTAPPPFSAVLADCASMIATLGVAFRPCAFRPCSRSVLPTRSHTRLWRQERNC